MWVLHIRCLTLKSNEQYSNREGTDNIDVAWTLGLNELVAYCSVSLCGRTTITCRNDVLGRTHRIEEDKAYHCWH